MEPPACHALGSRPFALWSDMHSLTLAALALIVGILGPGLAARADSPKALPVHPGAPVSIQGYGKQNPACQAWTDGCVLCTTDHEGTSQCSTPGIACQPHGLTCKALRR